MRPKRFRFGEAAQTVITWDRYGVASMRPKRFRFGEATPARRWENSRQELQ